MLRMTLYLKWDNESCNKLIDSFNEKSVRLTSINDSINYNIYKCIKGYQFTKEKIEVHDYSLQYFSSIKYLYKIGLGDYLTSFVNDLYYKSDLYSPNSSTQFKSELLELLEYSLNFTIKDLNLGRFFSKIEHFRTLNNIAFLYININPNNYNETLHKINEALRFYEINKTFLESKNIDSSHLYFLLKLKSNLLYKTNNFNEGILVLQKIIEILYEYKSEVDSNFKERISEYYVSLIYDSFKISNFSSLIYLIDKFDKKIPEFELSEIKYLLEANTIDQKLILIEKLTTDLENQIVSPFKQEALYKLISYLVEPYGEINKIILNSTQEKKLILHYYYIKYLISTNDNWTWKLNPKYKIYDEKVHLDSFLLIYKDFNSAEVDINFKEPIDYLKRKHEIINEIIETNNPYKSKLLYTDFIDKINYEIREHQTSGKTSDDDFIVDVLNTNISIFKQINPKYKDLISLLELINIEILKMTLGLDYYVRIEKTNKLRTFIKTKLTEEFNIEDLNLRINICNSLDDYKKIKKFTESNYKINKITSVEYIKLINSLNFLEYDIFEEQDLNIESNKTKLVNNDFLLPIATKTYNYFITNIDKFNDYFDYSRIISLIKRFNFQPNIQLINKYLTFYNNPGLMLTNQLKFTLDQNLGELYLKIKNYPKARYYFYAANANSLVYDDISIAMQKWDILMNIYFCTVQDTNSSKDDLLKTINYIKGVFEDDIERIKNIESDNISRTLIEIQYKYNIICLYEAREQKNLIKEKNILIEQLELNKSLKLYTDFNNEFDLIKCQSKLNEISDSESLKLITNLYLKYDKKQDISFALVCEKLKDFNSSFNIQLNFYTEELIKNLKYLNKLSYNNQLVFFNEIWDHRQYILRPYFNLPEEEKQKNLSRLIEYFILSDNVDVNNSNLYANNESTKIDELILEKKKLFNCKSRDEDYDKISNNIDLLQQNLKFKENNINWNLQSLRDNLKDNQAYIRIFSSNGYYAFIITKTSTKLIDLNKNNIDFQKAFNAYMTNLKEENESPLAYDIFYSKIFNALPKEANELFFQNEGVFINLNPDGFKSNSTQKYLIEDYEIHTINSSYSFNNLDSNVNFENALFIGNPKFQIEKTTVKNTSIVSNNTRGSLSPLPNTEKEVIEVSKQLNILNIKTNCLLQNDATEENLNRLSSSFDLIHIATHGFYKDDGSDKINQYDFGLYLTGALDYINKNQLKSQMIDEGIVYAPEIELLNLSKTKLVVLSACETGFGRQSKIGKISLSSSFIMAGTKNILSTLWKIDDKVTMEFINEFYKKLLQLKNIKSALRQTQLEFLEKYKSPYYWAPFMLLQNRG